MELYICSVQMLFLETNDCMSFFMRFTAPRKLEERADLAQSNK